MRKLVRVVPMQTDTSNLVSLISNVQVYWPAENQTITQSDPVFGKPVLAAKTLAALTSSSSELLADSGIELGTLLMQLFGEAIALEEDKQILVANAAPFTGLLFAASVNQVTMATGNTTFAQVTFQNVSDLIGAITTAAARNARFFMHRTVLNTLKQIRDLNHNYIWSPPTAEAPGSIWGYPYTLSDAMPSSTEVSTNFIGFGDPQNILLGDRQQMTVDVSSHVGFKQHEIFYRVTERIASLVGIPAAFSRLRTAAS